MDIQKVYEFRKYISNLYENDIMHEPNLNDSIIDIYNTNHSVEKISIALQQHHIRIVLKESEASNDTIREAINYLGTKIQNYILNNLDYISVPENDKTDFMVFVNSDLLFDVCIVGRSILITL